MTESNRDAIKRALSGGKGRSPVYRWLRQNHGTIAEAIEEAGGRPDWQALADLLRERRVMNGKGDPPTVGTVRDQWRAVCSDLAARGAAASRRGAGAAAPAPASSLARNAAAADAGEESFGLIFAGGPRQWAREG